MSDLHCRPKGERAIPSHLAVPVRSAEWSEVQERAARRDLLDQITEARKALARLSLATGKATVIVPDCH